MSESGDYEVSLARQKIYSALEMSPKGQECPHEALSMLLILIPDKFSKMFTNSNTIAVGDEVRSDVVSCIEIFTNGDCTLASSLVNSLGIT